VAWEFVTNCCALLLLDSAFYFVQITTLQLCVRSMQGVEETRGPLTPDELGRLRQEVVAYISDRSPKASLSHGGSMLYIRAAFQTFKSICSAVPVATPKTLSHSGAPAATQVGELGIDAPSTENSGGAGGEATPENAPQSIGVVKLQDENRKLRLQVQQRDNEINILVSLLKKQTAHMSPHCPDSSGPEGGGEKDTTGAWRAGAEKGKSLLSQDGSAAGGERGARGGGSHGVATMCSKISRDAELSQQKSMPRGATSAEHSVCSQGAGAGAFQGSSNIGDRHGESGYGGSGGSASSVDLTDLSILRDRNRAFELFRKSYRRNAAIEDHKLVRRGIF
jgi:kinesin family member 6/9